MTNLNVDISTWNAELGKRSVAFLGRYGDFDFKNLTLEDHSYLYEHGFGKPSKLVSVYDDSIKVGHVVLYECEIKASEPGKCFLMSDFYVEKAYRNLRTVTRMYTALKDHLEDQNVGGLFSVSNEKSTRLNERFLGISQSESLRFGIGIANSFFGSGAQYDVTADFLEAESSNDYSKYFNHSHLWNAEFLRVRLNIPDEAFKVHCFGSKLVVSQRTRKMGVPIVLIVGIFGQENDRPHLDHAILDSICASHRIPFYCAETNDLPSGVLKNFIFVKSITVYHRGMPQDQRFCLLDLDLSLGSAA